MGKIQSKHSQRRKDEKQGLSLPERETEGQFHSVVMVVEIGPGGRPVKLKSNLRSRLRVKESELQCRGFMSLIHWLKSVELALERYDELEGITNRTWEEKGDALFAEWQQENARDAKMFGDELRKIRKYRNAILHQNGTVTIWSVTQTIEVCHNLMKALWDFKSKGYVLCVFCASYIENVHARILSLSRFRTKNECYFTAQNQ